MRLVFLILVVVALIGVVVAQRRGKEGLRFPAVALALLAMGLAVTFALRPKPPAYLDRMEPFHRSVGYMLGRSLQERFPETTKVIVLQDRREDPTVQRLAKQQAEGLKEGLGNEACELVLLDFREIEVESTLLPEEGIDRQAVLSSFEKFKAVLAAHPEVSNIVSFVGYPSYLRLLLRRDDRYGSFVWDLGLQENVDWDAEMAGARVLARVSYARTQNLETDLPREISMEEIFARRYQLATAP
jgi:hypothetical protein